MGIKHYSIIHFYLPEILREIEARFYEDDPDDFDDDWINFVENQPNFIGESTSFEVEVDVDSRDTIRYYISLILKENGVDDGKCVFLDMVSIN